MSKKLGITLFYIVIVLSIIIYVIYSNKRANKVREEITSDFIDIHSDIKVFGMVTDIIKLEGFKNNPYSKYVVIDNRLRLRIFSTTITDQNEVLSNVVHVGSRIIKLEGDDYFQIHNITDGDTVIHNFEIAHF